LPVDIRDMYEDVKYTAPCLKMIASDFPIFGKSFEVMGRMIATREFQGGFGKRYDIEFFFKHQAFQHTFVNSYAIMKKAAMDRLLYIIPLSKTLVAADHVTFVMPQCKYNLDAFIAKKPSKSDVCEVFSQLCYALAELHELGYVHRDLRPEHILVDVDPLRVRLCGFSSARLIMTMI
jgi:serine/threonine protein kinase